MNGYFYIIDMHFTSRGMTEIEHMAWAVRTAEPVAHGSQQQAILQQQREQIQSRIQIGDIKLMKMTPTTPEDAQRLYSVVPLDRVPYTEVVGAR